MPKPKTPPMSAVRQRIMDDNGATPEQALGLHIQLYVSLDKLKRLYVPDLKDKAEALKCPLQWTGDAEQDGNTILLLFFESQRRMREHVRKHTAAQKKHRDGFLKMFNRPPVFVLGRGDDGFRHPQV
jgi:hypothetical protein